MTIPSEFNEVIQRRLAIPLTEGPDKVASLEEALRRLVKPGMLLYLGTAMRGPMPSYANWFASGGGESPGSRSPQSASARRGRR